MKLSIVQARPEHIVPIAADMREADRFEVWASDRHSPEQALRTGLERSILAWAALADNAPVAMWGVAPCGSILRDTGIPWMLSTPGILRVKRIFRQSRFYVDIMQSAFPKLENYVHAANAVSIRWLAWCGFSLDTEPTPINGEDFLKFWREPCAV